MPIRDILSNIQRSIKDIFKEFVEEEENSIPDELKKSITEALEQAKEEDEEDELLKEEAAAPEPAAPP